MGEDDNTRKKIAECIASLKWLDGKILGVDPTTMGKCKKGQVPNFQRRTVERLSKEFGLVKRS